LFLFGCVVSLVNRWSGLVACHLPEWPLILAADVVSGVARNAVLNSSKVAGSVSRLSVGYSSLYFSHTAWTQSGLSEADLAVMRQAALVANQRVTAKPHWRGQLR